MKSKRATCDHLRFYFPLWDDGFAEEARVSSLTLDPVAFPNAPLLKSNAALGRLTAASTLGDLDGDGDFDELNVFGTRSFTICHLPSWQTGRHHPGL